MRALLDRGMTSKTESRRQGTVEEPRREPCGPSASSKAELVADDEHAGSALEITRDVNGVPRSARIDAEFVSGFEFKRIRESARAIGGFLDGPLSS